jgi:SAM-dependent methyltransferase
MNQLEDLERRKREFFDALAEGWEERGFTEEELAKVVRLRQRLGDLRGLTILEPGCGAGRLTRLLAEWTGPEGKIMSIEVSTRMIASAARAVTAGRDRAAWSLTDDGVYELPASGPHGRITLQEGKAEEIDLPAGSVDLALLFCVFPHFSDKTRALRHFRDMLSPGGRLVISHLEGSERLNCFHQGAGEPVRLDRIPEPPAMLEMLKQAGLKPRLLLDWDEEYYLEAVPGTVHDPPR